MTVLSATALKALALIFMTTDHIGKYIPHMPMWFRYVGRLALPLFFFCAAESMAHTRDRRAYLKRLWIAAVVMSALECAIPQLLKMFAGLDIGAVESAVFLTIFQGALIIYLIEETKSDSVKRAEYLLGWLLWQTGTVILYIFVHSVTPSEAVFLTSFERVIFTALGSVIVMEGTLLIVLMIPLFYFFGDGRKKLSAAYLIYCGAYFALFVFELPVRFFTLLRGAGLPYGFLSIAGLTLNIIGLKTYSPNGVNGIAASLFSEYQWMMVFALPIILLYNGKKGRGMKRFFYIYYPAHIFLLHIAGALMK